MVNTIAVHRKHVSQQAEVISNASVWAATSHQPMLPKHVSTWTSAPWACINAPKTKTASTTLADTTVTVKKAPLNKVACVASVMSVRLDFTTVTKTLRAW